MKSLFRFFVYFLRLSTRITATATRATTAMITTIRRAEPPSSSTTASGGTRKTPILYGKAGSLGR